LCMQCMADSWCASWFLTRATSQHSRTTHCQQMRLRHQRPQQPMLAPLQLKQRRRLHPQRRPPVILNTLLVCNVFHMYTNTWTHTATLMTIFRLNRSRPVAPGVGSPFLLDSSVGRAVKCLERINSRYQLLCDQSIFLCLPWLRPNLPSNFSAAASYAEHS